MCGSSQVHPERYVPVHAGNKLGCRDSLFLIVAVGCVTSCILLPICGIIAGPIIYYIKLHTGTLPTRSPTMYPTMSPQSLPPFIDINSDLTNLTNYINDTNITY